MYRQSLRRPQRYRQTLNPSRVAEPKTIHNVISAVRVAIFITHTQDLVRRRLEHKLVRGFTSMRYINRLFTYLLT